MEQVISTLEEIITQLRSFKPAPALKSDELSLMLSPFHRRLADKLVQVSSSLKTFSLQLNERLASIITTEKCILSRVIKQAKVLCELETKILSNERAEDRLAKTAEVANEIASIDKHILDLAQRINSLDVKTDSQR